MVNIPIAGAAILLAAHVLKPDAGRIDAGKLDWLGAALLCPGLAGIVFGLSETETHGGITHLIALGPILVGLALVGLFIWHSLRVERPLIDLRLFRSPGFSAAAATTFFLGAALFGTLLILPLYYQVDRGERAECRAAAGPPGGWRGADAADQRSPDRPRRWRPGRARRVLDSRRGHRAVDVRNRAHSLSVARRRAFRPRGGTRRRGPTLRRRGLPADRFSTGARATAALNTLRQVGGSIGATLLAVILQHEGTGALSSLPSAAGGLLTPLPNAERLRVSGPVANAFGHTFFWALLMALVTIVPAAVLIHAERSRPRQRTTISPEIAKSAQKVPQARAA